MFRVPTVSSFSVVLYVYIFVIFSFPFDEMSLVGFALDLVDQPSSFSAMTLLVESYDM